jgi:hypothetical protein
MAGCGGSCGDVTSNAIGGQGLYKTWLAKDCVFRCLRQEQCSSYKKAKAVLAIRASKLSLDAVLVGYPSVSTVEIYGRIEYRMWSYECWQDDLSVVALFLLLYGV